MGAGFNLVMLVSSSSEGWDCWQMPCTVGSPPQTCFFRRLALVCTHPLTSTNKKRGAGPEFSLSHISTTWSTLLLWIWLEFRIYISNMGSDSAVRNIVKDWDKPLMRWKVILETNLTLNNQIHLCVLGLINWQWSDLTLLPPSSQYKTLHPTTPHDTLPPPHQSIKHPTIPWYPTQSHQHISQYRNTLPLVLGQDLKGCQLTTCRSILFIDVTALAIVDISYHQDTTYPLRLGLTLTKHKPNHLTGTLPNCPLQQHHRVWAAITEQRKMEADTNRSPENVW